MVQILSKTLSATALLPLASTSVDSPETLKKVKIPETNCEFAMVFSKDKATSLPPHRAYDCAIDLLPGTAPHCCKVYPLSLPEQCTMELYIQEVLQQSYICPTTSPVLPGFFFFKKKRGGLRPCIDYRGLNHIKSIIHILCCWIPQP